MRVRRLWLPLTRSFSLTRSRSPSPLSWILTARDTTIDGFPPFASLNTKYITRRAETAERRRNSTLSYRANSHRSATCHGHLAGYSKSLRRRRGRLSRAVESYFCGSNAGCWRVLPQPDAEIKPVDQRDPVREWSATNILLLTER